MHEGVIVADIPQSCDNIAFDAFWPRGCRRYFTLANTIGPVGELFQGSRRAHAAQCCVHRITANSALQPAVPRFDRAMDVRIDLVNMIQTARQLVTQLMTKIATRLQLVDPVILTQHSVSNTVALLARAFAWKKAAIGRLQE